MANADLTRRELAAVAAAAVAALRVARPISAATAANADGSGRRGTAATPGADVDAGASPRDAGAGGDALAGDRRAGVDAARGGDGAASDAARDPAQASADSHPAGGAHAGVVGVARLLEPPGRTLDDEAARAALAAAIGAATGQREARTALAALFRPADVVGIKVNALGGPRLAPRPPLVAALAALLVEAGIRPERIVVFDRSSRELERAGYTIRRAGGPFRCHGIDNDFEREPAVSGEIGSCYARLVTTGCTALISFGVVKDHDLCGVSGSLKNWYGVIHNPNKYHANQCDPFVADVVRHPWIAGKLRLAVLDGVTAQCHGGPAFRPDAIWRLGAVAASADPVAIDAWAWRVIDGERQRRGLATLAAAGRPPRFLATAARHGLGVGDPAAVREVQA